MKKRLLMLFWIFIFGLLIFACVKAVSRYEYLTYNSAERRTVNDILVYNATGLAWSANEWAMYLQKTVSAYVRFKKCIGGVDEGIDKKLTKLGIIIVAPGVSGELYGNRVAAFTDHIFILIDSDRYHPHILRHEWLHNYKFLKEGIVDPKHEDPNFYKKC